ncbi:MAG: 3-deoxy-7-phosphoheptulonate synthase [Eggerthellaceae bacterium]|nr:3-deoxy-7-phosphoheptulonate synthase [Eggerthellaceae bacterium]
MAEQTQRPITIIAGPCAVESEEQLSRVAETIREAGLSWLRGGAFKPRTSPYSFQGLGDEGLSILSAIGKEFGLSTITEVVDVAHVEMIDRSVDCLQIGMRNMANYELLKAVGNATAISGKHVLLKRGMAATISEWLAASEYLTTAGSTHVMLCERGIRTFETATRFTLDITAVPIVHKLSILPVCVDVSHPAGQSDLVPALAKSAVAAGCDALMIEVHPDPLHALSDGPQQLTLSQFTQLVDELRTLAAALGRELR